MNGRFVLDSNIVTAFFAHDTNVVNAIKDASKLFVSLVAVGELYYGATISERAQKNTACIDDLISDIAVVCGDIETARLFGTTKARLQQNGTPIPDNDIWIAAVALQHSLKLVSRDAHFTHVENLSLTKW